MKTLNMIGKDGGGDGTGDGDPADGEGGGKNEFMCHKYKTIESYVILFI